MPTPIETGQSGVDSGSQALDVGIDVGVETIKIVVMRAGEVVFAESHVTEEGGLSAATKLFEKAMLSLGLAPGAPTRVVSTGVGKKTVSFAERQSTDMIAHAKGARWLFPTARTVLDVGASGSRAMKLGIDGKVEKFALNAKCASGTGAFLRNMTEIVETPLEEMSVLSYQVEEATQISNYCAVFAESEVISKIHSGETKPRIIAGIYAAIADRLFELVRQVGLVSDLVVTGGVARSPGLIRALEKKTGLTAKIPQNPEILGALGAALIASEISRRSSPLPPREGPGEGAAPSESVTRQLR